jgi:dTDP-4-amino-4,6-dideoxygalactose transaminase
MRTTSPPWLQLPGAEAYYARCPSLPLFAAMSDADVVRVADALAALVAEQAAQPGHT